jgi:hypothetical protein
MLDKMVWSRTERYVAAIINVSLKNSEPEYCIIVKDMVTDSVLKHIILDVQPDAAIHGDSLLAIQRDTLGMYTEVVSYDLTNEASRLLYKCTFGNNCRIGSKDSQAGSRSVRVVCVLASEQHFRQVSGRGYVPSGRSGRFRSFVLKVANRHPQISV